MFGIFTSAPYVAITVIDGHNNVISDAVMLLRSQAVMTVKFPQVMAVNLDVYGDKKGSCAIVCYMLPP